jgi:thiosulfate/3-mercaptopyruvate sulfurtransferase
MKKLTLFLSILFAALFISSTAFAQSRLISPKDAAKLIGKNNVTFISGRTAADYQKVHIPGAISLVHSELYGAQSMLLPANEIAAILSKKGIASENTLLIYDDGSGKYAGRLFWILDYMGAKDVRIIDGGMKGWRMDRKPVTKNPTNATAATFTANVDASKIATMAEVKKATNSANTVVIDARSGAEFNGTATTTLKPGHIPAAINIEFTEVLQPTGLLKSTQELTSLFTKNGVTQDKSVIVYCESSVRAGIVYFALRELGFKNVSVYDGAYLEWQSAGNAVAMR